ncbi:MAG: N-formylglutamate amidohydrolase [Roseovarius sp.]|nr:N-formylglutamate amidohydrolase [Roseovarius sp.]
MTKLPNKKLLGNSDPHPVEIVNANSQCQVLLLCEHAGRAVPAKLGTLCVATDVLDSHRGWDIGAENVARGVADALGAPLVIQRYSRLVIDANRPPDGALAIPVESDGVRISGNVDLTPEERQTRVDEVFRPMDAALAGLFDAKTRSACFSIHSYTPVLGTQSRPWHAGFLSRADLQSANALLEFIRARRADLTLAVNEPYQIEDDTDWFIPRHAEPRGLIHALVEIRNDLITEPAGAADWAALVAGAIDQLMEDRA